MLASVFKGTCVLYDIRTYELSRKFSPILLSQDHKPTREDESKRIRDAGGFVINNRVMGELAVSRAFGDVDFKKGIQVTICLFVCMVLLTHIGNSIKFTVINDLLQYCRV